MRQFKNINECSLVLCLYVFDYANHTFLRKYLIHMCAAVKKRSVSECVDPHSPRICLCNLAGTPLSYHCTLEVYRSSVCNGWVQRTIRKKNVDNRTADDAPHLTHVNCATFVSIFPERSHQCMKRLVNRWTQSWITTVLGMRVLGTTLWDAGQVSH